MQLHQMIELKDDQDEKDDKDEEDEEDEKDDEVVTHSAVKIMTQAVSRQKKEILYLSPQANTWKVIKCITIKSLEKKEQMSYVNHNFFELGHILRYRAHFSPSCKKSVFLKTT